MKKFIKAENGQEYHHAICDHCGKYVYPSNKNVYIFFGFMCADTRMFVSNNCKEDFYKNKHQGVYGIEHKNKYSETPVIVPWKKEPKFLPLFQELIFDKKNPSQLLLFE
jgi:hypothetical protein